MPIIHAKDPVTGKCISGKVIDLVTGKPIRKVKWCNTDTGDYEAFAINPDGSIKTNEFGVPITYMGNTKLEFVPNVFKNLDLAKQEKEAEEIAKIDASKAVPILPVVSQRCQEKGCDRVATWSVADEELLPPVRVGNRLYERGMVKKVRRFCSWHYQPPRLLDAKGDVIKNYDESVRPD